jgi:hypothetical protein
MADPISAALVVVINRHDNDDTKRLMAMKAMVDGLRLEPFQCVSLREGGWGGGSWWVDAPSPLGDTQPRRIVCSPANPSRLTHAV